MTDRAFLQSQLKDFYATVLAEDRPKFDGEPMMELSAPILISVSEAYLQSKHPAESPAFMAERARSRQIVVIKGARIWCRIPSA